MAAETILLDLDGTVWNSRPWYAETIACLSGVSCDEVERKLLSGKPIVQLAREHYVSKSNLVKSATENAESLVLYKRVKQTLKVLRGRGTPIGVVTNLPGWLVRPLLESKDLKEYFFVTITPRWGIQAKPRPHGIFSALEEIGRGVNADTWFVGDGTVDAQAAEAAGIRFAWASYGYEPGPPPGTSEIVEKFEDILRL